jgi:casein kinase I homolog HRR25
VIIKPTSGRLQEVFGNYQTIKKLGSGTFGEVYLGVDLVSNRQVAIKLESVTAPVPMLKLESQMYAKLRGWAGVTVVKVQVTTYYLFFTSRAPVVCHCTRL